jgi:hypothetical protein
MKKDIQFLKTSKFCNHFNFSPNSDPFLVYTSKNIEYKKFGKKIVLNISSNLIKRIRASELIILEETVN